MKDFFDKCEAFFSDNKTFGEGERHLAADIFSNVSPPGNAGPWMECDGRRVLQFSTNDYLGLAMHPEVRARAVEIVEQYGICSPMGSRLMTGTTDYHIELERKMAQFKRCESAVTFASGAMAMMGTLISLAGARDLLILDERAHASLILGAKASGAKLLFFRHNDVAHLESILERTADEHPSRAIVVDGVYSMDGDLGPLAEIAGLKKKYHARLIVDDAHGTGVFGEEGRGTAAHLGVEPAVDIHLGTFSKAIGTIGGFAAGDATVIEFVRYHAPTYIFTKAMPLVVVAATLVALDLLQNADDRRRTLWSNCRYLQQALKAKGLDLGRTESPITPIQLQGNDALYIADKLRKVYGIWVSPVVYPAISLGRSIIRVIPTAQHTEDDLDRLVDGLAEIRGAMVLGSMPVN
ncbi:MAG: pyridoxal phosphate-dependent aminotransferase family protein [Pirellulales bacterium]|nr:pyridoxal phosphate-dependent aminotransferase family protein [Pirellulales bacterium]